MAWLSGYTNVADSAVGVHQYNTALSGAGSLSWTTFFGSGNGVAEQSFAIARDASGNLYVTGSAAGGGLATAGAYDTTVSAVDAFVARISSTGTLNYFTYFGGTGNDYGNGIEIDSTGKVVIAGQSYSTDAIASTGAYDTTGDFANGQAFAAKFDLTQTGAAQRVWGTYYGNSGVISAHEIALMSGDRVVLTGRTEGSIQTTANALDASLNGGGDAFVAVLDSRPAPRCCTAAISAATAATFCGISRRTRPATCTSSARPGRPPCTRPAPTTPPATTRTATRSSPRCRSSRRRPSPSTGTTLPFTENSSPDPRRLRPHGQRQRRHQPHRRHRAHQRCVRQHAGRAGLHEPVGYYRELERHDRHPDPVGHGERRQLSDGAAFGHLRQRQRQPIDRRAHARVPRHRQRRRHQHGRDASVAAHHRPRTCPSPQTPLRAVPRTRRRSPSPSRAATSTAPSSASASTPCPQTAPCTATPPRP
jgi:hypothetical protein